MNKPRIVIVLTSLLVALSTPCWAGSSDVDAYNQRLSLISSELIDHDYYSNFSKDGHNQNAKVGPCSPNSFCGGADIDGLLLSIQKGKFKFISPEAIPTNAQALLSDMRQLSQCADLAFMNAKEIKGEGGPPGVPLRPTGGFGIYQLPFPGRRILLVRGSEYNVAWPFWGADISGVKLPPAPPAQNTLGGDFLTEIDAQNCKVIEQFNLERLNVLKGTNFVHISFSEPILIDQNIYILHIVGAESSDDPTVYDMELISFNMDNARVLWTFRYATFFGK